MTFRMDENADPAPGRIQFQYQINGCHAAFCAATRQYDMSEKVKYAEYIHNKGL